MTLMKLSPETVRLRRVSKAHALGEFSMAEYRQARREVIDNFEPHRPDEDDTQPRVEAPQENGSRAAASHRELRAEARKRQSAGTRPGEA